MDIFKNKSPAMIVLIVLLSPVYIVLFGEIFMRLFAGVALMPRYVTGADDGIRMNIPNAVYGQTSREVDVEVRINSVGMRADREFTLEKPDGACRIAVLGDSFFMGYEVDIEHSFSHLLEANLAEQNVNCEVLNFSVSGFGTAEYVVALESRVLPYSPDLVIFELHETDLNENVISDLYRVEEGALIKTGNDYLPAIAVRDKLMQYGVYRWLIEHSQLYSVVREHAGKNVKKLLLVKNTVKGFFNKDSQPVQDTPTDTTGPVELQVKLLEQGRETSHQNGAEFLLVDIPNGFDPPNYFSVLDRQLKDHELPSKFNLISPLSTFTDPVNADTLYYYQTGHLHLSIDGNEVVAKVAADAIINQKLLDRRTSFTSAAPTSAATLED